jgi:hypothetical protein
MILGVLNIPVRGGKYYEVWGGPYRDKPVGMAGVKMAREVPYFGNGDLEIGIPTQDFKIPPIGYLTQGLTDAVKQLTRGELLYVGCMAGRGRTGLFLAILVKAFGVKNPVEYVRAHYFSHAVETLEQYNFVENFEIPRKVRAWVYWAKFCSYFTYKDCLNDLPF